MRLSSWHIKRMASIVAPLKSNTPSSPSIPNQTTWNKGRWIFVDEMCVVPDRLWSNARTCSADVEIYRKSTHDQEAGSTGFLAYTQVTRLNNRKPTREFSSTSTHTWQHNLSCSSVVLTCYKIIQIDDLDPPYQSTLLRCPVHGVDRASFWSIGVQPFHYLQLSIHCAHVHRAWRASLRIRRGGGKAVHTLVSSLNSSSTKLE